MKKLTFALMILLATATTGCVEEVEEPTPEPETSESTLEPTYIAGHLGNYADCPDEAFDPDRADAAPRDIDGDEADCDGPDCGILNCEGAQVTLRISNTGDEALTGITVLELLILDEDLIERASLPIGTINVIGDEAFDGTLEPGEEIDLRVDYQGPRNLGALLASEDEDAGFGAGVGASLRIRLQAEGQEATKLDTPELDALPQVDT